MKLTFHAVGKSSRSKLIRDIDKYHSLFIRARDNNTCVQCGSTKQPTCGHVIEGRHHSTRWDTHMGGNAYCQCWACNFKHGKRQQQHYITWYLGQFGQAAWEELVRRDNTARHYMMHELRELLVEMKRKVAEQEAGM